MGVSSSLIAAAIAYWITDHNLVRTLVIGGTGIAGFLLTYLLTKRPTPPTSPVSVHQENKQEFSPRNYVENKPVFENKPIFENKPVFENKPTFIISTGAAPAPAALPDNRPKLTFDRWDILGETLDIWQRGFFLGNHGDAALDVQVQRFQIAPDKFASSKTVPTIPAHGQGLAPVWLEGYSPFGFVAEKWDLLRAMKEASDTRTGNQMFRPDYIVPITVTYKDFDENLYESTADLHYVPARGELVFHATRQRKIDAYSEVLAFLQRTSQPGRGVTYFVEHIAEATGFPEQQVSDSLRRLFSEEQVYRSPIEGIGSDGGRTKWGYVYWYAHF
jgi:hypothetical protein